MAKPENTICVDFDGVVHDYLNPVPGRKMGPPMEGAVEALERLQDAGYHVVILTVRGDQPGYIIDWCDYYDVPYNEVTNKKPNAIIYIDDRAIRHINWDLTMQTVKALAHDFEMEED
jgi:predicted TIM-barrel enzyme